jgi:hypothetical protein
MLYSNRIEEKDMYNDKKWQFIWNMSHVVIIKELPKGKTGCSVRSAFIFLLFVRQYLLLSTDSGGFQGVRETKVMIK